MKRIESFESNIFKIDELYNKEFIVVEKFYNTIYLGLCYMKAAMSLKDEMTIDAAIIMLDLYDFAFTKDLRFLSIGENEAVAYIKRANPYASLEFLNEQYINPICRFSKLLKEKYRK